MFCIMCYFFYRKYKNDNLNGVVFGDICLYFWLKEYFIS